MTPSDVVVVQKSFSHAIGRADAIARTFYDRLFAADPTVRPMFARDMAEQRRKLMLTLGTVVQQLHSIEAILPTVRALARRHVDYGVQPRHYDLVGGALLDALAAHLPNFGETERDAWSAAYRVVASEMLRAAAQPRAA